MEPVNISIFGINGIYVLWLLTIVAMAFFLVRIVKIIQVLRKARSESRAEDVKAHVKNFFMYVLGQRRLFDERSIGLPHFLFFWGFVFFALSFWWNLFKGLFPFLPIPYSDEVGFIAFMMEVTGVLVLLSIIVAVARRVFFPPEHLQQSRDAAIILSLIAILMVTFLLGQGYKSTIESTATSPAGNVIASAIGSISIHKAESAYNLMWWLHMMTVLFFLAYIPYSKHMHLLASPFNVLLSSNSLPADLTIKSKADDFAGGASKWEEFTWKELLNCFSCAECGRCDRACPALNSGLDLSPRDMLHKIKEHLYETAFSKQADNTKSLIGDVIPNEEIWQCTSCMSCMQKCPVLNEHLQLIVSMRRYMVNEGLVEPIVQDALLKLNRYGNSFGQSDRNRAKWTIGLDFKIKDARKEEAEYLWVTGDYAAFDTRLQEITRKTARIFNQAGLDFGILYEAERNSGNDARRIGEEGLFDFLKEKNILAFEKAHFQKIVTTDPHTYNTLKNEYHLSKNGNGKKISVYHYTEVINELIKENKLPVQNRSEINATYHDPCYLGRYNGIYEPPRQILKSIGVKLTEMPRNRSNSYCCGAGGGRIWMEDKSPVKERPSESRVREAASLVGVDTLVVACPKDIVMFQDAVKTTGNENVLKVRDISELVFDAVTINAELKMQINQQTTDKG